MSKSKSKSTKPVSADPMAEFAALAGQYFEAESKRHPAGSVPAVNAERVAAAAYRASKSAGGFGGPGLEIESIGTPRKKKGVQRMSIVRTMPGEESGEGDSEE